MLKASAARRFSLGLKPVEPDPLIRAAQVRAGGLDQSQVVIAVGGAGHVQFLTGSQGQAFGRVVADSLQQPVAGRAIRLVRLDQALVDQSSLRSAAGTADRAWN
jgi:hypothetical protein